MYLLASIRQGSLNLRWVSSFHFTWGYVAVVINGVVGLWGVMLARRESIPRAFYWAVGGAVSALLTQVLVGTVLLTRGVEAGDQHVFYGVVVSFTFSFVYIYRAQFRKRPALYYGLLLLFTMGLGIRGIMTFGLNF